MIPGQLRRNAGQQGRLPLPVVYAARSEAEYLVLLVSCSLVELSLTLMFVRNTETKMVVTLGGRRGVGAGVRELILLGTTDNEAGPRPRPT